MKIKTQVSISLIIFFILAIVIIFSFFASNNQLHEVQKKQQIIDNIEKSSFELYYLENDYLIHGGTIPVDRWNAKYAALAGQLQELALTDPSQQAVLNNLFYIYRDLNISFSNLVAITEGVHGKEHIGDSQDLKGFYASTLAGQMQTLMSRSTELAELMRAETIEVEQRNTLIILVSIAVLILFVLLNYLIINHSVLKSISALKKGTECIGSGDLDIKIEIVSKDELGYLSLAFNEMSSSLKNSCNELLTSNSDLKREIEERKRAEEERVRLIAELGKSNEELSAAYEEILGVEEELKRQFNTLASVEENLRQTNAYLENLISIANVPIIVWDPSFRITRLNHAFELLIDRSAEEVVGNSLEFLFLPDQADRCMRLLQTTLDGVRWETVEIDIMHRDGSVRTLLWNSATLYTQDGLAPVATIAQGHDITEERRLEEEKDAALVQIQKNLAQLAILNDGIRNPLMIIVTYADMLSDPRMVDLITVQTQLIDEMVNQLDRRWTESEKVLDAIRKHYQIHVSTISDQDRSEDTDRYQPGNPIERAHPSGQKSGILIEEVQAQLYTILDSIDALVYVADMDTHDLLFMNRRGRALFGDITGQKCYKSLQSNQDGPCLFCTNHLLTDQFGPTGVYQWEYRSTLNGRWYDCRDRAIRWSDGRLVRLEIATDITDRKRTLEELQESEVRFRLLFQNMKSIFSLYEVVLDKNGKPCDYRFLELNPAYEKITNMRASELIGRTILEVFPLTEHYWMEKFEEVYISGIPTCVEKYSIELNTYIELNLYTPQKGQLAMISSDITERKRAEEALRESEEKYRSILKASPDDITNTDMEGVISMVSPAALTMLGFKREDDLVGHSIVDFIVPEDWDRATANIALMHQGVFTGPGEYRAIRADGSEFDIEVNAEFVRDSNGQPTSMVFIVRDITERKRSEEALHEANQKLRILTGLTRHDIFNQLSAAHLFQDLAINSADLAKVHEYISHAQEVNEHIEAIIGFTREYENFGIVSSGWQRIYLIIDSAKTEVSISDVTVHNQIPEELQVYADPIIRKVFTTLFENTIRHGGEVTFIQFFCSEVENALIITYEDDGVGIPSEEKEYIFDNEYGKHTGIGLFLAREILSITGLSIRECGVEGKGAKFEITVPGGKYRRG